MWVACAGAGVVPTSAPTTIAITARTSAVMSLPDVRDGGGMGGVAQGGKPVHRLDRVQDAVVGDVPVVLPGRGVLPDDHGIDLVGAPTLVEAQDQQAVVG